ncbi:MAG TPA: hypothetical protein PLH62_08540, partial [Ferruginibacter sp.]|nr:hypothetical protein [Ferruginibacter sp.]
LMADGTAPQCGRVGSCHIHLKPFSFLRGFFILYPTAKPELCLKNYDNPSTGFSECSGLCPVLSEIYSADDNLRQG